MSLRETLLVYFVLNFVFIGALAYKIMIAEIPHGWKTWTAPVLSMATAVTILLVLGLMNETAGYLGMFVFILLTGKRKEELEKDCLAKSQRDLYGLWFI